MMKMYFLLSTTILLLLATISLANEQEKSSSPYSTSNPLKLMIGVGMGSPSHAVLPFEIGTRISSKYPKGHVKVTFMSHDAHRSWLNGYYSEHGNIEFESLGDFSPLVKDMMTKRDEFFDSTDHDSFLTTIQRAFKMFNSNYEVGFVRFSKWILENRPHLVICDSFAWDCIDAIIESGTGARLVVFTCGSESPSEVLPNYISSFFDSTPRSYNLPKRLIHTFIRPILNAVVSYIIIKDLNQQRTAVGLKTPLNLFRMGAERIKSYPSISAHFMGLTEARPVSPHNIFAGPTPKHPVSDIRGNSQLNTVTSQNQNFDPQLRNFLVAAKKKQLPIVLIAGGSVLSLSERAKNVFFEFLSDCSGVASFVWAVGKKTEDVSEANIGSHVYVTKWIDQVSLLYSGHVDVFVTHGGIESINEALTNGVPMLVRPVFGDQPGNAARLTALGVSITIDKRATNGSDYCSSLKTLLTNQEYRKRAKDLQKIAHLRLQSFDSDIANLIELEAQSGIISQYLVPAHLKLGYLKELPLTGEGVDIELWAAVIVPLVLGYAVLKNLYARLFGKGKPAVTSTSKKTKSE